MSKCDLESWLEGKQKNTCMRFSGFVSEAPEESIQNGGCLFLHL